MLYNLFENRDFVSVFAVALLAEGVDRNTPLEDGKPSVDVALLAEGVDRNRYDPAKYEARVRVALLAEGVDRNIGVVVACGLLLWSPSSRRAWIEIPPFSGP